MPVIDTAIEPQGVVRIFFDMRIEPHPKDELLIAAAIERAAALADSEMDRAQLHRAA